MRIVGISGSLRKDSWNTRLLNAAAAVAADKGQTIEIVGWNDVPVFSEDLESPVPPEAVTAFRAAVQSADAILFATPEYNNAIPGGLKNLIDWGSRAPGIWSGKVVAVMGATVGGFGAVHGVRDVRHVMTVLGAVVIGPPNVNVPKAQEAFYDNGGLKDPVAAKSVATLIDRLVELTGLVRPG